MALHIYMYIAHMHAMLTILDFHFEFYFIACNEVGVYYYYAGYFSTIGVTLVCMADSICSTAF